MDTGQKTIVGRSYEKEKLGSSFDSPRSEFIVVYGRRRIGKTYLIRNFFLNKPCFYFQVTGIQKASAKIQLAEFSKEISRVFYGPGIKLETPKNWMAAFVFLLDKDAARELQKKYKTYERVTRTTKQIFISMITTFGMKPGLYKEELIHSEMTLEDFFKR